MNINLSEEVAKQLEEHVKASKEFTTVEEYVNYVLTEVLKQTAAPAAAKQAENSEAYTKTEEDEVKKRLADLGYLD